MGEGLTFWCNLDDFFPLITGMIMSVCGQLHAFMINLPQPQQSLLLFVFVFNRMELMSVVGFFFFFSIHQHHKKINSAGVGI